MWSRKSKGGCFVILRNEMTKNPGWNLNQNQILTLAKNAGHLVVPLVLRMTASLSEETGYWRLEGQRLCHSERSEAERPPTGGNPCQVVF